AARDVAERRGIVRAEDAEEVREARRQHPEVRLRALRPLLVKRLPVLAYDIHPHDLTRHGAEARGVDDDVELVEANVPRRVPGLDPLGRDAHDRSFPQIDELDVLLVEDLV